MLDMKTCLNYHIPLNTMLIFVIVVRFQVLVGQRSEHTLHKFHTGCKTQKKKNLPSQYRMCAVMDSILHSWFTLVLNLTSSLWKQRCAQHMTRLKFDHVLPSAGLEERKQIYYYLEQARIDTHVNDNDMQLLLYEVSNAEQVRNEDVLDVQNSNFVFLTLCSMHYLTYMFWNATFGKYRAPSFCESNGRRRTAECRPGNCCPHFPFRFNANSWN